MSGSATAIKILETELSKETYDFVLDAWEKTKLTIDVISVIETEDTN